MLRNSFKAKLLLAVSAFAISAVTANAQEHAGLPGDFWMEFSGMLPFYKASKDKYWYDARELVQVVHAISPSANLVREKLPYVKAKNSYLFTGEFGYKFFESPWFIKVNIGHAFSKKRSGHNEFLFTGTTGSHGTPVSAHGIGSAKKKERLSFLDFEVGRDVGLGKDVLNVQLSGGVRILSFTSKEYGTGTLNIYVDHALFRSSSGEFHSKRKFLGAGPKIGINVTAPLSDTFALRLNVAGAVLFGKRKVKGFDGSDYFIRNKSAVVPNVDANVGFAWRPTDSMQFTIGYGVNAFFNLVDNGYFEKGAKKDRIIHGPKIGLRVDL